MNLIGHFASAQIGSDAFRLGAVLPDLMGLHHRKARAWRLNETQGSAPQNSVTRDILAGVAFHYAVDQHFHRAGLFSQSASRLIEVLKKASAAPGLKRFFPAHILSELFFDHLLIQADPTLTGSLKKALGSEAGSSLAQVAAWHPVVERARFEEFLDIIRTGGFMDDYEQIDGILRRMNRILRRFRQRPFEAAEEEALQGYFARWTGQTRAPLHSFMKEMETLALEYLPQAHGEWNQAKQGELRGNFVV